MRITERNDVAPIRPVTSSDDALRSRRYDALTQHVKYLHLCKKAKKLGKDYGRASDTIHRLRGDIALLRVGREDAAFQVGYFNQRAINEQLRAENQRLRESLTAAHERKRADA